MKSLGSNSENVLLGLFAFTMTACLMGSIVLVWGMSEAVHFFPSGLRSPLQVRASASRP